MTVLESSTGFPALLMGLMGLSWSAVYLGLQRVKPVGAIPMCIEARARRTLAAVPAVICVSLVMVVGGLVALP
jgi:hypothetical protein